MNIKGRNKISTEFNTSSMTDLVFLLLIFFMILSTLVKQNNVIDMNLPKSSSTKVSSSKSVVSVDKNFVFRVDNQVVDKTQIVSMLQQKLGPPDASSRVEIAMDEDVPHSYFVELVDLVSVQAGYKISIQTKNSQR
ncbi:MAG: biopolymer transporter ExbD [Candidatus Competibacteraceae bacterium]|nr:biopolymer transporter ExbD [Candidatus Competibacteraceae bacterium]